MNRQSSTLLRDRGPELLVLAVLVPLVIVVGAVEPTFLSFQTLFNVLTASIVAALFGLGVMLIMISGGIDVSFLAIGIFAAYVTCKVLPLNGGITQSVLPFVMAIGIGMAFGCLNALIVLTTKAPVLIATLATSSIITGAMFTFFSGDVIANLPAPLRALGQFRLVTMPGAVRGTTSLTGLIIVIVVVAIAVALWLTRTTRGRTVLALGGSAEAASRAGVQVALTRLIVFIAAGGLAGLAGMTSVVISGRADPTTFTGGELSVLAAVVLGGTLITGGRGSVGGVLLGVLLISVIEASLVPLGIPTIWQSTTVGALLLVGVGLQTLAARRRPDRPILDVRPDDALAERSAATSAAITSSATSSTTSSTTSRTLTQSTSKEAGAHE